MDGDLLIAAGAICSGLGSLFVGLAAIKMAKRGDTSIKASVGLAGSTEPGGSGGSIGGDSPDGEQSAGADLDDDDHPD